MTRNTVTMHVDFRPFERALKHHAEVEVPAAATKGMRKSMLDLLNSAISRAPTVPLDKGTLRSTGTAHVNDDFVGETGWTDNAPERGFTPNTSSTGFPQNEGDIVGMVGFNTPYATRVHEEELNFKEPSAGSKYLELKLLDRHGLYLDIIAVEIERVIR